MRETKFRGWDTKEKRMLSPEELSASDVYLDVESGHLIDVSHRYPDGSIEIRDYNRHIPLQYTGLKDKNGKEIFEGDIVAIDMWQGNEHGYISEDGVIQWYEESSAFKWFSGDPSDGNNYWLSHADAKRREVIGNIYENPELLRGD